MLLKPNAGRALSALGAVVVVASLFLTWYHIDRAVNSDTTGWQTFPNLRIALIVGAAVVLATAAPRQTRPVLVVRTIVGLLIAAFVFRRIVSPPDLAQAVHAQAGVYVGFVGGLAVALGGLVDTGRQVAEAYPGLWRQPLAQLGPGRRTLDRGNDDR